MALQCGLARPTHTFTSTRGVITPHFHEKEVNIQLLSLSNQPQITELAPSGTRGPRQAWTVVTWGRQGSIPVPSWGQANLNLHDIVKGRLLLFLKIQTPDKKEEWSVSFVRAKDMPVSFMSVATWQRHQIFEDRQTRQAR